MDFIHRNFFLKIILSSFFGLIFTASPAVTAVNSVTPNTNSAVVIEQRIHADAVSASKDITVKKGEHFSILLQENSSTGYSWSYTADSKNIKLLGDKNIENQDKSIVGAPSNRIWTFKSDKKGTYKIAFQYKRPWEKDVPPAKKTVYNVKVQ